MCDGAMGTMLYAKGIFVNKSFDALNLAEPDLVGGVHREYVRAGADVLETNTFGANRLKLAAFGLAEKLHDINVAGARIARQAARDQAYVAGAIGPLGIRIEPWGKTRRRRGRSVLPRAGRGAARGRRRPVRARDVPRSERDRGGNRRGAVRQRSADRGADDDRGGRQHPRWHAAGEVRAGARRARRHDRRPELQRRTRAHARNDRADRAERATCRSRRSRTPAGRATSRAAPSTSRRPSTWRRTRAASWRRACAWSAGCCGTTPEHIRQIKRAVQALAHVAGDDGAPARRRLPR